MKVPVAAILLLSTILVQATPVKKREASAAPFDPFAHMVQKSISENDFYALWDLTKNLQIILQAESKNEGDQKIIEKSLETLKEATHHLENFHCQVPVITSLVTEPPTEIADTTLENEEVTETVTDPTQFEDSTEQGSLCDDCEVDYEVNTKYAGIFKSCMGTSINDVPRFLAIFELPTYLVLLYNIQFRWLSWTPAYLSIRRQ